jgi:hypothetical protein
MCNVIISLSRFLRVIKSRSEKVFTKDTEEK